MKRILAVLAALILAVFALTACSDNNDSSDNDSADHDGMAMTSMPMTSMPTSMSMPSMPSGYVDAGSVVDGNRDQRFRIFDAGVGDARTGTDHSEQRPPSSTQVTSDTAGLFNEDIEAGETETITVPNEPGTYTFHCTYHPSMHGTLTVK